MKTDSLCMGCMNDIASGECPSCGWVEGTVTSPLYLKPRTVLNGRYVLGKVLGQGGFGITYLSYDLETAQKVAVKEYLPFSTARRTSAGATVAVSAELRELFYHGLNKFIEEAQSLQRLSKHSGIVQILDLVRANGTGYMVNEFIDGITLVQYLDIQEERKISFQLACPLLAAVMAGLRYVHEAHIIHRDVTPDNIMLSKTGEVKLIDFSLATRSSDDAPHSIIKTGYSPIEQYSSTGVVGPWTDVYSLAATFYRCLTGIVPPEAPSRLYRETLSPPAELGVILPGKSERALLRALSVQPEERYQTVADFERDVLMAGWEPSGSRQARGRFSDLFARFLRRLTLTKDSHSTLKSRHEPRLGLRLIKGNEMRQTVQISSNPIIIGSNRNADVVISSRLVSGAHVRLWCDERGRVWIEDLHSSNGTYLQRSGHVERLAGVQQLGGGDGFFLSGEEIGKFEVVPL